jgi:large subunit ribosomal protein L9
LRLVAIIERSEELIIMASTTILLREDIDELGGRGEIVKVRAGYARNYLLPQGLASLATKGNVKQIEQERSALLKKAAVEKATAEGQKDQMGVIELSFERQAGEHGTLFGSVTTMDIAEALQAKGYEIDRRRIVLKQPIKETGDYAVKVRLHREVLLDVPVHVTAIGGEEVAEQKAEKKPRRAKKSADETESAQLDAATAPSEEAAE